MATLFFCANTFLFTRGNAGFSDLFHDVIDSVKDVVRSAEEWEEMFEVHLNDFSDYIDGELDDAEKAIRLELYKTNVDQIERINKAAQLKGHAAPMVVNKFAILDPSEIPTGAVDEDEDGTPPDRRRNHAVTVDEHGHEAQVAPAMWNWRSHRGGEAVRWVKNQRCNNCWAHASLAALETRNYVTNCMQTDLSINMVADCTHAEGSAGRTGCDGWMVTRPFDMATSQGLPSTPAYMSSQLLPGVSFEDILGDNTADNTCRVTPRGHVLDHPGSAVKGDGYFRVTDWEEFKWEIFNNGACALNLGVDSHLNFLSGNVMWTPENSIDHSVTAVGYGVDGGVQYIVAKNSWGATWGDSGFFRMRADNWSATQDAKFKIYCPKVKPNGACKSCKDGEVVGGGRFGFGDVTANQFALNEHQRAYSSVKNNNSPGIGLARSVVDSPTAWVSNTIDISSDCEYIQFDLFSAHIVAGVVTQGRHDADEWVTYFTVEYSRDGHSWTNIPSSFGGSLFFKGNSDRDTKVTNMFQTAIELEEYNYPAVGTYPVTARYVRIIPKEWDGWMSLRAEILIYSFGGCFCAGVTCSPGQVCSFERGCVAPAPGTHSVDDVNHIHTNNDDGDSVTNGEAGITSSSSSTSVDIPPVAEKPAPVIADENDVWDVAGPVSVFVNCVIMGCMMGAFFVYWAMTRSATTTAPVLARTAANPTMVELVQPRSNWQEVRPMSMPLTPVGKHPSNPV